MLTMQTILLHQYAERERKSERVRQDESEQFSHNLLHVFKNKQLNILNEIARMQKNIIQQRKQNLQKKKNLIKSLK